MRERKNDSGKETCPPKIRNQMTCWEWLLQNGQNGRRRAIRGKRSPPIDQERGMGTVAESGFRESPAVSASASALLAVSLVGGALSGREDALGGSNQTGDQRRGTLARRPVVSAIPGFPIGRNLLFLLFFVEECHGRDGGAVVHIIVAVPPLVVLLFFLLLLVLGVVLVSGIILGSAVLELVLRRLGRFLVLGRFLILLGAVIARVFLALAAAAERRPLVDVVLPIFFVVVLGIVAVLAVLELALESEAFFVGVSLVFLVIGVLGVVVILATLELVLLGLRAFLVVGILLVFFVVGILGIFRTAASRELVPSAQRDLLVGAVFLILSVVLVPWVILVAASRELVLLVSVGAVPRAGPGTGSRAGSRVDRSAIAVAERVLIICRRGVVLESCEIFSQHAAVRSGGSSSLDVGISVRDFIELSGVGLGDGAQGSRGCVLLGAKD